MPYKLWRAEKSFCPKCGQTVKLLSRDPLIPGPMGPMFYICFACEFIGEVGVGPVELEK